MSQVDFDAPQDGFANITKDITKDGAIKIIKTSPFFWGAEKPSGGKAFDSTDRFLSSITKDEIARLQTAIIVCGRDDSCGGEQLFRTFLLFANAAGADISKIEDEVIDSDIGMRWDYLIGIRGLSNKDAARLKNKTTRIIAKSIEFGDIFTLAHLAQEMSSTINVGISEL